MNGEIDLIPEDYRKELRLRAWTRRLAALGIVALLLLVATKAALAYGIRNHTREVERLREEQALALDQQGKLGTLRARKDNLARQLEILVGLRGGVAARRMFLAVDRALESGVWLIDWSFRRAGELVEPEPETVHTGYFVVVPKTADDEPERAWLMQTHMEMQGQAFDHSSLAKFVARLVDQPEIDDVRILSTQTRRYSDSQVVHFELAVVVRSRS